MGIIIPTSSSSTATVTRDTFGVFNFICTEYICLHRRSQEVFAFLPDFYFQEVFYLPAQALFAYRLNQETPLTGGIKGSPILLYTIVIGKYPRYLLFWQE
jgi:hypothetical protein